MDDRVHEGGGKITSGLTVAFQLAALLGVLCTTAGLANAADLPSGTETVVFVRHGEKPRQGLGQLDCQGLNRSLALPAVLAGTFDRPAAIFAPNPSVKKNDAGRSYDYIRPLATIEPTAVALGMEVHADLGLADIAGLQHALESADYHASTLFVAWEHHYIVDLVRSIVASHGTGEVPDWSDGDFDSEYVLRLQWSGPHYSAVFERRTEGLDGLALSCPGHAGR